MYFPSAERVTSVITGFLKKSVSGINRGCRAFSAASPIPLDSDTIENNATKNTIFLLFIDPHKALIVSGSAWP